MRVLLCFAAVCVLAGCGGSGMKLPTPPSGPATPQTSGTTPSGPATMKIGDTGTLPDGERITLRAAAPVATPKYALDSPTKAVFGVDLEWCAGATAVDVSGFGVQLVLADNTRAGYSLGERDPAFVNATLAPSACNAGWVTFATEKGAKPAALTLRTLRWVIS